MKDTVLFDLDGTITDSAPGIMNSIRYALNNYGMEIPPESILRTFIGPPLKEQFQKVFGVSDRDSAGMVSSYREYYSDRGIYENEVYAGIMEMLSELKTENIKILMATAKPEIYARRIAEYFGFSEYFDFIGGACMDGRRTDKYEVIEYVLHSCDIKDRCRVIMAGDRSHDMIGAKKAGVTGIGVLYGYGTREELKKAGASYLAETPEKLKKIILSL